MDEHSKHELLAIARKLRHDSAINSSDLAARIERIAARANARAESAESVAFQPRVKPWMLECFGATIAADVTERCDRFVEEALELVQALRWPREHALALVDYVYGRPIGEPSQEVGGVMVTLAALCLAVDVDMHAAGETELARISAPDVIAKIRAKQAAKPTGAALPIPTPAADGVLVPREAVERLARYFWNGSEVSHLHLPGIVREMRSWLVPADLPLRAANAKPDHAQAAIAATEAAERAVMPASLRALSEPMPPIGDSVRAKVIAAAQDHVYDAQTSWRAGDDGESP